MLLKYNVPEKLDSPLVNECKENGLDDNIHDTMHERHELSVGSPIDHESRTKSMSHIEFCFVFLYRFVCICM